MYLAIGGSAEVGSQGDFTLTFPSGTPIPTIGETLYNRKVTMPAGRISVIHLALLGVVVVAQATHGLKAL